MKKIYCIIPAFNEADKISLVINEVKKVVDKVVVVDDFSSDDTFSVASKLGVIVLQHIVNRGQGAALQTGNDFALKDGADIVAHFDADGQFDPRDLKTAIREIDDNDLDAVLGSRFLGTKINMPSLKKNILFPIARLVNRWFFAIKLTDPQSGFRVLTRKVLLETEIENDGSAHCSEILYKLFKNKYKIKEIPITVTYNEFGQSFFGGKGRGKGGLRIVKDLFFHRIIR